MGVLGAPAAWGLEPGLLVPRAPGPPPEVVGATEPEPALALPRKAPSGADDASSLD